MSRSICNSVRVNALTSMPVRGDLMIEVAFKTTGRPHRPLRVLTRQGGLRRLLLIGTALIAVTALPLRFDAKGLPHVAQAFAEDGGHGGGDGGGGHGGGDGGGDSGGDHGGDSSGGDHSGGGDTGGSHGAGSHDANGHDANDANDDHGGLAGANDDPATHDVNDDSGTAAAGLADDPATHDVGDDQSAGAVAPAPTVNP